MKLIDSPLGIVERGGPLTTALLFPALEGDDAERGCSSRESERRLGELAQEADRDREGADLGDRRVDDIQGAAVSGEPRVEWTDARAALECGRGHQAQRPVREDLVARDGCASGVDGPEVRAVMRDLPPPAPRLPLPD